MVVSEFWCGVLQVAAWGVAGVWCWRTSEAVRRMPEVPVLNGIEWDLHPTEVPSLTVVVPARDEAAKIAATLDALLLADYPALHILVVDDRSTDATGQIMDAYDAEYAVKLPGRLDVLHIGKLPEGWLGKTHALSVATQSCASEWLLYTDADVLFSPSILRRAMAFAVAERADHVVVLPTMQVKCWSEGTVLGFFQVLGMWASRPWRVADPKSPRDVIGVGAFNLVRREALEQLGGWEPQRLVVLEDIALGARMKAAGMRQRLAFAPGLVLVHWAEGGLGLVRVMTKNLFSAFNFQPLLLLGACGWIVVFCLLPLAGMGWWATLLPGAMVMVCLAASYRVMGVASEIDARYAWLYPLGAAAFLWAMLRSMAVVFWQRGVVWRGTHYSLRELRQHNSPLQWERAARKLRKSR